VAADSTYIAKSPTAWSHEKISQREGESQHDDEKSGHAVLPTLDALAGSRQQLDASERLKACWLGALWAGILATHCSLIFYGGLSGMYSISRSLAWFQVRVFTGECFSGIRSEFWRCAAEPRRFIFPSLRW